MNHYNLALLGFGNVGRALARLLLQKEETLRKDYGLTFSFTGVATGSKGRAVNPDGLDIHTLLELVENGQSISDFSTVPIQDNLDFIARSRADVLFENTPVDYATGQPAVDHLRAALSSGMHGITANKGPVVHAHDALSRLAEENEVRFYFESTVMDGAPLFGLFRGALPAAEVRSIRGILNSTTNLILSRMEDGDTFDEAVAYAQEIGIAETDPSGDVDGWDAAIKIAALTTVWMGVPLKPADVDRQGIRDLSPADIEDALAEGTRWKLVCESLRDGSQVRARVAPERVQPGSPMYGVDGTTSIVQIETDVLGRLSLIEEDPGVHTTAYGLLADFINAATG